MRLIRLVNQVCHKNKLAFSALLVTIISGKYPGNTKKS